jgi:SHS2 domain-containing protein
MISLLDQTRNSALPLFGAYPVQTALIGVNAGPLAADWGATYPEQMKWETFAHEADVGVRGTGDTLAEAFAGAAVAMTSAICDPMCVAAMGSVSIECSAPDDELLLVDWLNALVYEMATRHMLFSRFDVVVEHHRLKATAWGESVVAARHRPAAEVKGASFCELAVRQQADGSWLAQCVVDV